MFEKWKTSGWNKLNSTIREEWEIVFYIYQKKSFRCIHLLSLWKVVLPGFYDFFKYYLSLLFFLFLFFLFFFFFLGGGWFLIWVSKTKFVWSNIVKIKKNPQMLPKLDSSVDMNSVFPRVRGGHTTVLKGENVSLYMRAVWLVSTVEACTIYLLRLELQLHV